MNSIALPETTIALVAQWAVTHWRPVGYVSILLDELNTMFPGEVAYTKAQIEAADAALEEFLASL